MQIHFYKNQKTAAWLLLGTGAGLAIAGYVIIQNQGHKDPVGSLLGEHAPGARSCDRRYETDRSPHWIFSEPWDSPITG